MTVSFSEHLWWIIGSVCYAILALVLCVKGIYKAAPLFSAWVCETVVASGALFLASRLASTHTYTLCFWTLAAVEVPLQMGVAYEFATKSLRPENTWVVGTKIKFALFAGMAFLLSATLALKARPAIIDPLDAPYTRLELFASDLIFFVAVITIVLSYAYGSLWRRQDLLRFSGFLIWSAASSISDTLHIYWRTSEHFVVLEMCHSFLDVSVAIYWIMVSLTSNSRVSVHPSAELTPFAKLYDTH